MKVWKICIIRRHKVKKTKMAFVIDFTIGLIFNFSIFLIDFLFFKCFIYCQRCGRIKSILCLNLFPWNHSSFILITLCISPIVQNIKNLSFSRYSCIICWRDHQRVYHLMSSALLCFAGTQVPRDCLPKGYFLCMSCKAERVGVL